MSKGIYELVRCAREFLNGQMSEISKGFFVFLILAFVIPGPCPDLKDIFHCLSSFDDKDSASIDLCACQY